MPQMRPAPSTPHLRPHHPVRPVRHKFHRIAIACVEEGRPAAPRPSPYRRRHLRGYTQVFKQAAPYAYSYAFDDEATMPWQGAFYYKVTFGTTGS